MSRGSWQVPTCTSHSRTGACRGWGHLEPPQNTGGEAAVWTHRDCPAEGQRGEAAGDEAPSRPAPDLLVTTLGWLPAAGPHRCPQVPRTESAPGHEGGSCPEQRRAPRGWRAGVAGPAVLPASWASAGIRSAVCCLQQGSGRSIHVHPRWTREGPVASHTCSGHSQEGTRELGGPGKQAAPLQAIALTLLAGHLATRRPGSSGQTGPFLWGRGVGGGQRGSLHSSSTHKHPRKRRPEDQGVMASLADWRPGDRPRPPAQAATSPRVRLRVVFVDNAAYTHVLGTVTHRESGDWQAASGLVPGPPPPGSRPREAPPWFLSPRGPSPVPLPAPGDSNGENAAPTQVRAQEAAPSRSHSLWLRGH